MLVCTVLVGELQDSDSGPVGDKIQGHPFSLPRCTIDFRAKAATSTGVRVMGLGLQAVVSNLHLREVHWCEETELN